MSKFILWLGMMIPLAFSAGPANITMAALGARFGIKDSLPFLFGINLVVAICALAIGFGVSNVMLNFAAAFPYLQLAGALYMFYLAFRFLKSTGMAGAGGHSTSPRFVDGVILQIFNAKMHMINIMMFSQFLDNGSPLAAQVLILTFGVICMTLAATLLWTAGGAWLMQTFATLRASRAQGYLFGFMLAAVGGWMCYEGWPF